MPTQLHDIPLSVKRDIARLLRVAGECGQADNYAGKRQSPRTANALRLEITTDVADPSASYSVMLHNMSLSGLAFWSRQRFTLGSRISVREYSKQERPWIRARIRHCTIGIRGYLIGAAFDVETNEETEFS